MTDSPSTQPAISAIEMRDVAFGSLRDQNTIVAEAINWTVASGEYWVVAGLQGSGKSDFLMMTGGVMAPASGQYRLLGQEMPIFEEERLQERLRLGLVFEGGQLFNHLTVSENVALPLRYHRNLTKEQVAAEVSAILEALELAEWADSTPGAIGRNWQKRVGLARALALKPEVLLIDTPLTGLDLRHTYWWLNALDELSRGHRLVEGRPMTLVVTTANLWPWKGRAQRFAVLGQKRLAVLGSWSQVEAAEQDLLRDVYETRGE